jgi:hypothetical protein
MEFEYFETKTILVKLNKKIQKVIDLIIRLTLSKIEIMNWDGLL